ncbi:hypothetical protein RvY_05239 [Ramazzottius varieornatus]|uniref:Polypeptide N-acetylgalactosaminyltransferase n=1 Tax=Ramazzottius varieornatus TaxID=947166 RepID=A0A1D1V3B9_RAMVA|nr:hypothetical protein RvY_05239 [Ramazzottius varieornatus]
MVFGLRGRSGALCLIVSCISCWGVILLIGIAPLENRPNTEVRALLYTVNPIHASLPSRPSKSVVWKSKEDRLLQKTGKKQAKSLIKVRTLQAAVPDRLPRPQDLKTLPTSTRRTSLPVDEIDIPKAGMILTDDDEREFSQNVKHSFNAFLSSQIPLDREVPEFRNQECQQRAFQLPSLTASVIICFYNEARSALLRTISSVIMRTAEDLVEEIILVDDASSSEELQEPLQSVLSDISRKVRLIRLSSRQGLIRARIHGARQATGDVLVFLDSHTEVGHHWMEPLLDEIHQDRTTVVCPVVDVIQPHTLELVASPPVVGGFNWGLHFRWDPVDSLRLETAEAVDSPVMSGGIFAIHRQYFQELGEYDEKMDIWGGENLEMSFRIWMCGGRLKIHPCSHVGHIFRNERPYGNDGRGDTQLLNSIRVAKVWLDEHIDKFYKVRPEARSFDNINVTERKHLRETLKCHSFQWYIDNVYPGIDQPMSNGSRELLNISYSEKFLLRHAHSGLCLSLSEKVLSMVACAEARSLYRSNHNAIVLRSNLCLDTECPSKVPCPSKCHFTGGSQEWRLSSFDGKVILNPSKGLCLALDKRVLHLRRCNSDSKLVLWKMLDLKNKPKLAS